MTKEPLWTHEEYLTVAIGALPWIDKGELPKVAFNRGQRNLPKARRRTLGGVAKICTANEKAKERIQRYIAQARVIVDATTQAAAKPAAAKPAAKSAATTKAKAKATQHRFNGTRKDVPPERTAGSVRWSDKEWTLLAHRIKRLQDIGQAPKSLAACVDFAQQTMLPPSRHRPKQSLFAGLALTRKKMETCLRQSHLLTPAELAAIEGKHYTEPASEPTPVAAAAQNAAPPLPPPPVEDTPPISIAKHSPEFAQAGAVFVGQMQAAIDGLLAAHAQHMFTTFETRLTMATEAITRNIGARIHDSLRRTVLDTIAEELGGPVAGQGKTNDPPKSGGNTPGGDLPDDVPRSVEDLPANFTARSMPVDQNGARSVPVEYKGRRAFEFRDPAKDDDDGHALRVDVVGLKGAQSEEVRRAFNGHTSLRFVESDKIAGWMPRKDAFVILDKKFLGHDAALKCARYHVKPISVHGGAGAVINAIKDLHQKEGIPA